jgi:hypothetical protein
MMTIKADDIQGRHQAYAEIVQGTNLSAPGRTAAFDGLCCEIRGLGMEVTLGKIVDSFEPVFDKSCAMPVQAQTLEEEYMVSSVDKLEDAGVKMLEIPAGDYVPVSKPLSAPMITSLTNSRGARTTKFDLSQEPLIDEVDDESLSSDAQSFMNVFIDRETKEVLATSTEQDKETLLTDTQAEIEEASRLSLSDKFKSSMLLDFPSLSELQGLADELISVHRADKRHLIGAKCPLHATKKFRTSPMKAAITPSLQLK